MPKKKNATADSSQAVLPYRDSSETTHVLNDKVTLVQSLCSLNDETEWMEFKTGNHDPEMIGERISALANSAALHEKNCAYMIWGVEDATHHIVGTTFVIAREKVGNQGLEIWLNQMLSPHLDLRFHSLKIKEKNVVLLEVFPCLHTPVR